MAAPLSLQPSKESYDNLLCKALFPVPLVVQASPRTPGSVCSREAPVDIHVPERALKVMA